MMPIKGVMEYIKDSGNAANLTQWMGEHNQNPDYALTMDNIFASWINLFFFAILFVIIAVVFLERIDKDKR